MPKRTQIYSIGRNYVNCRIWEGDPELIGTSTITPDKGLTKQQRKEIIETWLRKNGIKPKPLSPSQG